ncbi:MAG: MFS transporter [Intestinibacter sp.]|uniref:MFS transporter n=1 Tax=Intestinibacter sp. TaxID=1965304 RepID=UPI0025C3BE27|nr:MFS transporter [Intestinibacter sp.]MCI6737732.1 MFS transporter [Intestinibacter sp.]
MKALNRWIYAVVGVIVLLFAGLIYAWSVLVTPISQEFTNWSNTSLSLTFTICMIFFCLGGLIGGLLQKKIDVKINVWLAAVLFLIGFFISSKSQSIATLYVGYGVLAGFASGLAYNSVMSTMSKWFPDKQGLISGILLMGFGLGSFIIGKIYQAYTPTDIGGWRTSFMIFGIILVIVLGIGGFFFVKPGDDFVPPVSASKGKEKNSNKINKELVIDVNSVQMVKRPSFWFYFVWATLLGAAGLALISQASGIAGEVGKGVSASTIATVVGLISICNGIGRVIYGGMFDKLGRFKTMITIVVVFLISALLLIVAFKIKSFGILIVGFMLCGASYGGITSTNSAFINSFYGATHYPVNFPIVNLNLIIASFGSTIAGALYDSSGSYLSTIFLMIGAIAFSFICAVSIKRP